MSGLPRRSRHPRGPDGADSYPTAPIRCPVDAFDTTDFAILREMWAGPHYFRVDRVSLDDIGRAVGLHRSTVATRLAKWARAGFLLGVTVDVDPTALGLVGAHVQFHACAADRDAALETALHVEGVANALVFDQAWIGFPVTADSPAALARIVALLTRILEADRIEEIANTHRDFPDAEPTPLNALDVALVAALREDGRLMPRQLAERTGAPLRTVERRLRRLRDRGVVYTLPRVAFDRAAGMVVGYLHFPLPEEGRDKVLHDALARVPDVLVRQTEAPGIARLLVYAQTPADLEARARAVAQTPGVGRATLRVFHGVRPSPTFNAWLLERLERHRAASTRA